MFYIFFALALFMASAAVHIFFCRKAGKPGLHARAFVLTAVIFSGVYAVSVSLLPYQGVPFRITAGIIFILLVPVYLCFYVLTQLTSPSKKILLAVSEHGEIAYTGIMACVQKEDFIASRLDDLCASGCVRQSDGRYVLTSEGRQISAILNLMQFILGRNAGG